jgi:NADH dehydrogenase (ubiquinone) 1 beta subcomplex subunit 10
MRILQERIDRCIAYHTPYLKPCGPVVEDYEEAELNWFIKYSELGSEANAVDVLMKQKHRMIWERRHPEIMAERAKKYEVCFVFFKNDNLFRSIKSN